MNVKEKYTDWLDFDDETRIELLNIQDEKEIDDRFCRDLKFGTGGMRGLVGAGTNRLNRYTIRRATAGLAEYLLAEKDKTPSTVIAYDTRHFSREFADEAACVLSRQGVKVFLFDRPMPTPVLSFAVRYLKASSGIVITASHNPREYNGYKVYNSNGGQLVPDEANELTRYINKITSYTSINVSDLETEIAGGRIEVVGDVVLEAFIEQVKGQSIVNGELDIVYSPLHGTGNIPVRKVLSGFNVSVVAEQEFPDGDFSTVESPNPEERSALTLAIKQAEKEKADLVIGTDPDCDRLGAAVRHEGNYELLTGNQIGALLVDFVLLNKKITSKSTLIKTIVTNDLGAMIAKKRGLKVLDTLTGFKYIGEKINEFERSNEQEFVIGYEESFGYLIGTYARDKDAVVSALLLCEMAAYYKKSGQTLIDRLNHLYSEYGYYLDALDSFTLKGVDGSLKIEEFMQMIRAAGNKFIEKTIKVLDYSMGIDDLPKENVMKFLLENGSWVAIRPSGTEPKLKFYYSIKDTDKLTAQKKLSAIQQHIKETIGLE